MRESQLTPELLSDVDEAVEIMRRGGIILYPTDTIWGIGCDATNPQAVEKVYALKQRDDSKALITLVPDIAWLDRYVDEIPEVALQLAEVSVQPTTIIYDRGINLAPNLLAPDGSVGIRVTAETYSRSLCSRLRRPVVSTSANISGQPAPRIFREIEPSVIEGVDYVARYRRDDTDTRVSPSGVIKIGSGGLFKIIR